MGNIFIDFQEKKNQILKLTQQASEYNWISKERASEIIEKIESDVLTIGVIGQMKCGKSTFLNAFVFEDDVLPSATTPMTASLSIITYGEEKKIVAEFYSKEEWNEQKITANRDLNEVQGNEFEVSKIRAAKELVEKSIKLGNSIEQYLGKEQEDSFENLVDYVGADGKYISITKSVKIYYPKEYLKGVEIVDTPGMNDPIVSREERTKEFLSKADVVLMMLYAGRPFDATDHNILFENVRKCGTGKVLIGINKYDIPYMNGEEESVIKDYVEKELVKACSEYRDDTISDILKEVDPVLISANMALLSELPMSKVSENQTYEFDWKRYCDQFEINNQKQFRERSHIEELSKQVIDLIENEKGQILFTKPKNEILAAGTIIKSKIEKKIFDNQTELKVLSTPDEELEEKLEDLAKADRKMNKKLDRLSDDLEEILNDKHLPKMKRDLEDVVDEACKKMTRIVDDWGTFQKFEKVRVDLERVAKNLSTRLLPRMIEENAGVIKRTLRTTIQEYFSDVEELAGRYIADFDMVDFFESLQRKIVVEADEEIDSFDLSNTFSSNGEFWSSLTNGWIFTRASNKESIKSKITELSSNFSAKSFISFVQKKKDSIVENIKKETIDELIEPIQKAAELCKNDKAMKEDKIKKLSSGIVDLENQKKMVNEQSEKILAIS